MNTDINDKKRGNEPPENSRKTWDVLSKDIMATTTNFKKVNPDLMNYFDEMPATLPAESNPIINQETLKAYRQSLLVFEDSYSNITAPQRSINPVKHHENS